MSEFRHLSNLDKLAGERVWFSRRVVKSFAFLLRGASLLVNAQLLLQNEPWRHYSFCASLPGGRRSECHGCSVGNRIARDGQERLRQDGRLLAAVAAAAAAGRPDHPRLARLTGLKAHCAGKGENWAPDNPPLPSIIHPAIHPFLLSLHWRAGRGLQLLSLASKGQL